MERIRRLSRRALCAAVAAVVIPAGFAPGQFTQPSCPTVEDQVVSVTSQQATEFQVRVENLGGGVVSIFQYPQGGTLISGNSPTEFVFVPDDGFTGTTTFMFRVTPETGCPQGALLGKVTLVGPTTGRPFAKAEERHVCGVGLPTVFAACSLMLATGLRNRKRSRH